MLPEELRRALNKDIQFQTEHDKDIHYFYFKLEENFPYFEQLSTRTQAIIVELCFMGWNNFVKSHPTQMICQAIAKD